MDENLIEQLRLVVKFIVTHVNAKEAHEKTDYDQDGPEWDEYVRLVAEAQEIGKQLRDMVK